MVQHHHPAYLPPDIDIALVYKEMGKALSALGHLEGSQEKLRNATHLISPLIAKEAEVSSKIEGTQSSSSDIYVYAAGGKAAFKDTPIVSNYRTAMNTAIRQLTEGHGLSMFMIRSLHSQLLTGVPYKGVLGDFRKNDVWIAEKDGDPIEKALYVPPEHFHVHSYIENILEFVDNYDEMNLVKAGIAHYQFEAVHPFEDGNGRIGRLLIPLILFYKGELSLPIVYISGYFEQRPQEYRQALRTVDSTGRYEEWLRFYFTAIEQQARETMVLINRIHTLNEQLREKYKNSKSPYMVRVIDYLFEAPVFTVPQIMAELNLPRVTIIRLVNQLEQDKVLQQVQGQKGREGANLYYFPALLSLIQ